MQPAPLGLQVRDQHHLLGGEGGKARPLVEAVLDLVDAAHEVPGRGHRGRFAGHHPGHPGAVRAVDGTHRQLGDALQGLLQRLLREHELTQGGQALRQLRTVISSRVIDHVLTPTTNPPHLGASASTIIELGCADVTVPAYRKRYTTPVPGNGSTDQSPDLLLARVQPR